MTASRGLRRRDAGFTLVELVIVLTVAAVIAAISAPRFQGVRTRWRVEETARTLLSDARRARAEVARRGGRVELAFAPSAEAYEMVWHAPPPGEIEEWSASAEPDAFERVVLLRRDAPGAVRFEVTPRSIEFEADGSGSGGEVRVFVDREELVVKLDAASGAATLSPARSR